MAKITVALDGKGSIDNAAIFFDDPQEKVPYYLKQNSDTKWSAQDISVPMDDGEELNYAFYVVALTGTAFDCTLTNQADGRTIKFSDVTGKIIKNRAISKGSEKFT